MLSTFAFLSLLSLASATNPPSYSGFTLKWQSVFPYDKGQLPTAENNGKWNLITGYLGINNESEVYTNNPANIQCSGSGSLLITPIKNGNEWSSGRIESTYTFTPVAGKKTLAESKIRFGSNPASKKQGIWPAFWLLGQSCRDKSKQWPACGEIDVFENINGEAVNHGVAHCGTANGGPCNESTGLAKTVALTDPTNWHTWRVQWDRTPSSWTSETITWYKDGTQFWQIKGSTVNDQTAWNALAHSSMYFIVNVAVGGYWPGPPNANTASGSGSAMELAYVAHYVQN